MRSKFFFLYSLLLGIFGVNFLLPVNAVSSQWFPDVSTTSEFNVVNYLTKWDYTRGESNTFNIYNFSGNKYIVPSYMDLSFPQKPFLWNSLENNSRISVLIDYTERSPTELYRNARIKIKDTIYNNTNFKFVGLRNIVQWLTSDMNFLSQSNYINKDSFLPNDFGTFYDYFDCSLGVGSILPDDVKIVSVSRKYIIASSDTSDTNHTYLADSNGRVISYTLSFFHPLMSAIGHRETSFIFTREVSSSTGIPGFELYIILGILGILSVILIRKKLK